MEKTVPELIAAISPEEWAQVPLSVLKLIEELECEHQTVSQVSGEDTKRFARMKIM